MLYHTVTSAKRPLYLHPYVNNVTEVSSYSQEKPGNLSLNWKMMTLRIFLLIFLTLKNYKETNQARFMEMSR